MRRSFTMCILALLLSFTGCVELMQAYTLNPDGSGKVVLDTIHPANQQFGIDAALKTPEETIKKTIQERISEGEGIEAWSDITCEMTKDGKVHFRGTAYYSDINKLNASDSSGEVRWKKQGDAMVLTLETDKNEAGNEAVEPLTDAQIDEQVKQEKMQFQQMKPMMGAMFNGMKVQISATLPGKVAESNIFTTEGQTSTLTITGKQMIDAMEKINADDKLLRARIKAGNDKGVDNILFEQIFGKKGPAMVKVTGASKPLFDYKSEVAKAKAAEEALFKKLGVSREKKSEQ